MIKKIKLKDDYVCFFKNQTFEFKPITLLVGDQGCGKSTMLDIIKGLAKEGFQNKKWIDVEAEDSNKVGFLHFDLEMHNPRVTQANPDSSESMLYHLTSNFKSHGETLLPIMKELNSIDNKIILLDEPETSLSLRSQYLMIEIFKKCIERNNQLILATHNMVFIEAFPESILNLEQGKYVSPRQFVNAQKKPSDFKDKRNDKIIKKMNCRMGINCTCPAENRGFYDKNCLHYVDRQGKSGYQREGSMGSKMKKGDFKNG